MELYNKITPCPIIDALFEIRFENKIPDNAIFGIIYSEFKNSYPRQEGLPILQIPEEFRKKDSALRYCPHYRFLNDNFILQVGPSVLSISSYPKYVGWNNFKPELLNCIEHIKKLEIIKTIERLGLRYIDSFDFPILEYTNYNVHLPDINLEEKNTFIKTEFSNGLINNLLRIGNDAIVLDDNKRQSTIDIDTSLIDKNSLNNFFENVSFTLDKMHDSCKSLFFTVLNEKIKEKLEFS